MRNAHCRTWNMARKLKKVAPDAHRLHLVGESIGKLDVVIVDKPHAELRGASLRSVGHHRAAGSHHGEQ